MSYVKTHLPVGAVVATYAPYTAANVTPRVGECRNGYCWTGTHWETQRAATQPVPTAQHKAECEKKYAAVKTNAATAASFPGIVAQCVREKDAAWQRAHATATATSTGPSKPPTANYRAECEKRYPTNTGVPSTTRNALVAKCVKDKEDAWQRNWDLTVGGQKGRDEINESLRQRRIACEAQYGNKPDQLAYCLTSRDPNSVNATEEACRAGLIPKCSPAAKQRKMLLMVAGGFGVAILAAALLKKRKAR